MKVRAVLFMEDINRRKGYLKTKNIIDDIYDIISLVDREQRRKKWKVKDFGNFIAKGNVLDLAIGLLSGVRLTRLLEALLMIY